VVFRHSSLKVAASVAVKTALAAFAAGCNIFHDVVGLAEVVSDDHPPPPGNYAQDGTPVLYLIARDTVVASGATEPLADSVFITPWTPYVRPVGSLADSTRHVVSSDSSVVTTDASGLKIIAHAPGKATLTMRGWFAYYPVSAIVTITVRAAK
jgi:hypothetical protein